MLFRREVCLHPFKDFGPASQAQRPNRVITLPKGWRVIGTHTTGGYDSHYLVIERIRWFWQPELKHAPFAGSGKRPAVDHAIAPIV